ncbi:Protein CBG09507 [Caenorhabditis briggsae]|uniref:Protein CBG09507 n=1 Tax=Caenorhabditis briggsae TaxID=6238 RepID=A8X8Y3_CAEBR|nr:Protein CBG09507 [Caenorhabditis briggsae]CAP29094.2 Protein CBG09507 [Caenorhabditis briggsae]
MVTFFVVLLCLSAGILSQNVENIVPKNILGIGSTQSVAVSGRFICNGRPAANIKLKLYENEIMFDRLIQESRTDSNGQFILCDQKFTIKIPKDYVTSGDRASRTFDIGTLNLANNFPGQSTDCIN